MPNPRQRFCLVLIKPSHYDDDGYVIQWLRSSIPSNSLAALYGLAHESVDRKVLGADVEFEVHAFDETNTVIRPGKIAALIERAGAGMVMLAGVQSNQFPRALDIARPLRARGIQVAIGGFHVSGTMAMLKDRDAHVQRAMDMGVSLFAGEAEGRLDVVLRDAFASELKPVYNYMDDLPGLEGAPLPILPPEKIRLTLGKTTSFDAGRGCPFTCSFCTIINVQGHKSRRRSVDDIERIVRINNSLGLTSYFITDDNFARNKDWEAILDRLIYLREVERFRIRLTIQVDTLCHKIPNFIEKAKRAGVKRAFIGLENINPDNLVSAHKRQNKITDYRQMLLEWKYAGVITYCGYILGFPDDTPERILRDIEVIKKELPVDVLEFFYLTPLPGSVDHQRLHEAGVAMDPDLNKYDLNHAVTGHSTMSQQEWEDVYRSAWETYYTDEHVETILRRMAAAGTGLGRVISMIMWFKGTISIEKVHPLETGIVRRKVRRNRRSGLPRENPLVFYPKYWAGTIYSLSRWLALYLRLNRIRRKVDADPARRGYMDLALEPVRDDERETREMFKSESARKYLVQLERVEKARAGHGAD